MKFTASFFALALASVACGGSSQPAATPSQTTGSDTKPAEQKQAAGGDHDADHKEGAGGHEDHHAGIAPALKDFHGVLAPVWHSEAGKVRTEKACAGTKELQDKAKATGDAELIAAAAAIEPACAAPNRPDVEAKLSKVHDRFHALAEAKKH